MECNQIIEQSENLDAVESVTRGDDSANSKKSQSDDTVYEHSTGACDGKTNPYAYLERDEFTSERFKIEIRGLPKFYGIAVRKLYGE